MSIRFYELGFGEKAMMHLETRVMIQTVTCMLCDIMPLSSKERTEKRGLSRDDHTNAVQAGMQLGGPVLGHRVSADAKETTEHSESNQNRFDAGHSITDFMLVKYTNPDVANIVTTRIIKKSHNFVHKVEDDNAGGDFSLPVTAAQATLHLQHRQGFDMDLDEERHLELRMAHSVCESDECFYDDCIRESANIRLVLRNHLQCLSSEEAKDNMLFFETCRTKAMRDIKEKVIRRKKPLSSRSSAAPTAKEPKTRVYRPGYLIAKIAAILFQKNRDVLKAVKEAVKKIVTSHWNPQRHDSLFLCC